MAVCEVLVAGPPTHSRNLFLLPAAGSSYFPLWVEVTDHPGSIEPPFIHWTQGGRWRLHPVTAAVLLSSWIGVDVKGSDSWTVRFIHGSGETGAGYNPNSRVVLRKKRGSIVAWRETGFALSVVVFNEILHSHTCVYCKPFLPVSLKCTDELSVALLRISKEKKERILHCWSSMH